ncbi:MAG TPA: ATP-binding protein [Xanthobacteraceae bacterium]
MRLDRDHSDGAGARVRAEPEAMPPREADVSPAGSYAIVKRALPVAIAAVSIAGSALTVAALYWLVTPHGPRITGAYFQSDMALLTGVTIAACGALALMVRRNRGLRDAIERLETRLEDFSDRAWEVNEAEERAKSFLETQGDVIVRRDGDGRVTYANDAFCRLAGRARAEVIGSLVALPLIEQGALAVLADGTRVHDQKIESDAGPRWIAWREVLVRTETDGRTEMQSVGRDVTDRAIAERALADARDQADAANRAKSRFLAMVSHEIRTPLNGILGMAELLIDSQLTAAQTTYVKAVKTSGDTLLSLIGEILDFSKIEAGKLDLDVRPFALAPLVEEVVELLAPRAQAKGIEIAAFVDDALPAETLGDGARVRQVLLNLAGNAVKFTEVGGVSVVVEPGTRPGEVTFRVRDTGIGIAPDAQARIFEEFEQADGGPTRRHGGTGLGLSISQRIVERMGGRITVESAAGAGATFSFTVALPATGPQVAAPPVPRLDGAAVMIVAPAFGAIAASLVARRLATWGAESVVADPTGAPALLAGRLWDAVIVDRAVGPQATEAIGRASARTSARRIVLVTPGDRDELAAMRDIGFTGYLVKPVRAASLAARFAAGNPAFEIPGSASVSGAETGERAEPQVTGGLAILVAEDNEINALLARALLVRLGHRPAIVKSGTQAVDAWLAARAGGAPYDLILMDVHMPDLDGIAATRRIRAAEQQAGGARTPIVALTANAFSDDRDACLAAGMDAFLTKPLDRERLAELLAPGRATAAA